MFLTILSTIGIILLILLGVIIALVLLLLIVPFFYKVRIVKEDKFSVDANIGWMFNFLHVIVSFKENRLEWDLRLMGLPLKRLLVKDGGKKKRKGGKKKKRKAKRPPTIMPGERPDKTVLKNAEAAAKAEVKNKGEGPKALKDIIEEHEQEPTLGEKIRDFIKTLPGKIRKLINICAMYSAIKKRVFKLIRHVMPKKIIGYLLYGFDDPSMTGKTFGWFCIFYPMVPDTLRIIPYFDKAVFKCDLLLKGRIVIIYILVHGLKIYFSKEVKTVMGRNKGGKK